MKTMISAAQMRELERGVACEKAGETWFPKGVGATYIVLEAKGLAKPGLGEEWHLPEEGRLACGWVK